MEFIFVGDTIISNGVKQKNVKMNQLVPKNILFEIIEQINEK